MQQLLVGVSILLFGLFIGGIGLASAGVGIGIPMIPIGIYVTYRGWRICKHEAKTRKQQEETELVQFEKNKTGQVWFRRYPNSYWHWHLFVWNRHSDILSWYMVFV